MAHDVFISYSHQDKLIADKICSHLEANEIRCWYAPRNIVPGNDWASSIIQAIQTSSIMILVFSDFSNTSQQVLREVSSAVSAGVTLIPFRVTQTEPVDAMRYYLATVHWLDAYKEPVDSMITELDSLVHAILNVKNPTAMGTTTTATISSKKKPSKSVLLLLTTILLLVITAFVIILKFRSERKDSTNVSTNSSSIQQFTNDPETEAIQESDISEGTIQIASDSTSAQESLLSLDSTKNYGLTDADLLEIEGITIIGDTLLWWKSGEFPVSPEDLIIYSDTDNLWYWRKGAKPVEYAVWEDLSFITRMTNLKTINISSAGISRMPSLSSLLHLETISIEDSETESLDWLEGSNISCFFFHGSSNLDFSILDTCENLIEKDIPFCFSYFTLDQLETLSEQAKDRMINVLIAGDYVFNFDQFYLFCDSISINGLAEIRNRNTDEIITVKTGHLTNLKPLEDLRNLNTLYIFAQPIHDLEGIESFQRLTNFMLLNCNSIKTLNHLSTSKNLTYLDVSYCQQLTDLEGIEELTNLNELVLCGLPTDNYLPLTCFSRFSTLKIMDDEISDWAYTARNTSLINLIVGGSEINQQDLEELLVDHPEIETLQILYAENLSDLCFLIDMPNLKHVIISEDMFFLKKTIEDIDYAFELEIL